MASAELSHEDFWELYNVWRDVVQVIQNKFLNKTQSTEMCELKPFHRQFRSNGLVYICNHGINSYTQQLNS